MVTESKWFFVGDELYFAFVAYDVSNGVWAVVFLREDPVSSNQRCSSLNTGCQVAGRTSCDPAYVLRCVQFATNCDGGTARCFVTNSVWIMLKDGATISPYDVVQLDVLQVRAL